MIETRVLDIDAVRADFPILQRRINGKPLIYLDSAATSQKPCAVIDAMDDYYRRYNANPHRGVYLLSVLRDAYGEGFVELWDVQQREELFRWQPLRVGEIKHLAFTSDAAFLACSSEKQGAVHLLRLGNLRRRLADMGLDW